MSLDGKVAVVTGAGSGIGRASASIMAREGAVVIVSDLRPDAAAKTARLITEAGGKGRAVAADVTEDKALEALIDTTIADFGRLDILHSHAGVQALVIDGGECLG